MFPKFLHRTVGVGWRGTRYTKLLWYFDMVDELDVLDGNLPETLVDRSVIHCMPPIGKMKNAALEN